MKIELKEWSMDNVDELVDICNKIEMEYLSDRIPQPYTKEDGKFYLNLIKEHEGVDCLFRAIVVDGEIVGNISVEGKEDVYRCGGEIGYYLLQEYWSKGIMTYAVEQMCNLAFTNLDIVRLTANVYEPNIASMRVLEKNGFVKEGVMHNAVIKDNHIYNLHVYGKLKDTNK